MSTIERAMQRARRSGRDAAANAGAETLEHPSIQDRRRPQREYTTIKLDLQRLRRQGYLTPEADQRDLQEQYRMVKRPLLGHAFGDTELGPNSPKLIQVTSSVDAEGKTFTAFNLAMSIAMEMDFTVVVVDSDLSRRALSSLVGLERAAGLTDILQSETPDVGEVIYTTNVPRLSVIPAGRPHPRSAELTASGGMRQMTRELATRYPDRVVLFDSPPLLMDSQAATLAAYMGQVLVVVEAGRTSERVLRDGLELVDQSRSRVGLLLNKSPRGYGYGYYGGYY